MTALHPAPFRGRLPGPVAPSAGFRSGQRPAGAFHNTFRGA